MNAKSGLKTEYRQYTMEELDERFDAEGNMIDWRQRYLDQGREEGIAEGRAEGREEGREEGMAEGRAEGKTAGRAEERLSILQQVLQGKFNVLSEAQLATILKHRDEPDLFTRIIKANTIDELLKSLR